MMKVKICLILIISSTFICFSQAVVDKPKNIYYNEKIILCLMVNGVNKYIDTILTFRNYIDNNDEKRIVDNDLIIDKDIDKLIWECKYIARCIQYQSKRNFFSIISYKIDNRNRIIASYFLCDRKSKEAVEMMRFQMRNKNIIGINVLPGIVEGFIPIDEYDSP